MKPSKPKKRARRARRELVAVDVHGEKLRLNKGTGQGYFLLPDPERGGAKVRRYQGKLLDEHGDPLPATLERAQRFLAEWRAAKTTVGRSGRGATVTVAQLVAAFTDERKGWAQRDDLHAFGSATRPLCDLYGTTLAPEFGPLALKAVRGVMVESGKLGRKTINDYVRRLRTIFRWGVENELVPPDVALALDCVAGLKGSRVEGLREPREVQPVVEDHVTKVLPRVSPQVRAIIEIMRCTGARCGEIVQLRPCDVERGGDTWVYRPATHKTQHRGHQRMIPLGPRARAILAPWLLREPKAPCFSPAEAEESRRAAREAARVTPSGYGNVRGSNRKASPERAPGDTYTTGSVRRAIHRACDAATVPRWNPHQIRHAVATRMKRELGDEAARVLLGHRSLDMTAHYVAKDLEAARAAAERLG